MEILFDEAHNLQVPGLILPSPHEFHEVDPLIDNEEVHSQPYPFEGPLNMTERKIKQALHVIHDTNASMSLSCWKFMALEDPSSLEAMENIQKALSAIKGNFLQFIFSRDYLLELVEMYHGASLRDAEEVENITLIWIPPKIH